MQVIITEKTPPVVRALHVTIDMSETQLLALRYALLESDDKNTDALFDCIDDACRVHGLAPALNYNPVK